jgi:hypothetical protein
MSDADGKLEVLVECGSVPEAYGIRSVLEESGIPCLVQGEHTVRILGSAAMEANVRVLVSKENLAAAQAILEELNSGEDALAEGELPETDEPGDD